MIDRFIHQYIDSYTGNQQGRWCHEDGCFYKGVADLYAATNDEWYCKQLIKCLERQIEPDGKINGYDSGQYRLDHINAGKVLFLAYEKTNDLRYLIAMRSLREQLSGQPRTKSNNFWHNKKDPYLIWLDGLYMALPFLAQFSLDFENGASLPDIRSQFFKVRSLMFDAPKGLYYHGYDETQESCWSNPTSGCSACFWSRAMGWYVMALVDLFEIIGPLHEDHIFYARLLEEVVDNINAWQQPGGLWLQIMDQPNRQDNYPETSASAMFAYGLLKGQRLAILGDHCKQIGHNAFEGIVTTRLNQNDEQWELDGICDWTGFDEDDGSSLDWEESYACYINESRLSNDPRGVGAFMMAYAEVLRQQEPHDSVR